MNVVRFPKQKISLHPEAAREAGTALFFEAEEAFNRVMGFYPTSDQTCHVLAYALGDLLAVPRRLERRADLRAEMLAIIDNCAADEVR